MIRDRVMPYQIHNYAHNNEWCCRNLRYVGRVKDSIALARNLAELPRHPKHNDGTNGWSAGRLGRDRLYDALMEFELWDDALRLAETPLFDAAEKSKDEARRARLVGAAYFGKGDFERGQAQLELVKLRLKETEQAADEAARAAEEKARGEKQSDDKIAKAKESARKKHDDDLRRLREAAEHLRARRAIARGQFTEALAHFGRAGGVSSELLSQTHLKAGDHKKALDLAKRAFDSSPGQVAPLANYVDVLHGTGKTPEAAEHFAKLRSLAAHADVDLPVLARLADIAQSLGYPADWRQPNSVPTDLGVRPDIATLGPFRWSPYRGEFWHLADSTGKLIGTDDYRGKPVVLMFYLGHGCVHCIEQLNAFAPRAKDYTAAGISLAAISSEPATDLKKSLDQCKLEGGFPFPLVSDASLGVFRAYRAFDDFENVPLHATFLVDGQGLVRWQDIGYQPFSDAEFLLKEAKRLLAINPD
jgi:peroxiredoxin